ncbi:MAG: Gfo/Idh/MocA family oxidoreductase [Verrucomicrobia bacterium]|jgi:predicted dehydrogenase|nr:Gfo/Idh/MocA family oxidoreductase [Verrucomicrobiota bacterium]OQC64081.1 MAG: Inositol 2-dehydrogenase [Verrucomicrobia bacterium ADurb.Bin006]MDI9381907.1 Gfo/Idh/MocA family oxidoreductase [Verrucomicrobiota bacterium]HOA62505.1 Gfo/Idh/MocA family oxidoreductase [Verrucomicrobiota bacterium]HOF48753.1 Gfo/Idh/MocA family oxidoreductase [Verrucomicrobiota bacterium]
MNTTSSRRAFLRQTALATAVVSVSPRLWGQVAGANSDIRVGVVGFGGRGGSHISAFSKMPGVRLVALCDCDEKILGAGVKKLEDQGKPVKGYRDYRELLEKGDVDVVASATPNHWHSLNVVWACQAGKDVYIEKPISHNVWEGRQAVEAARKYRRIVQSGTQSRSSRTGIAAAVEWVRAGNLGKIKVSRALCYKRRASIGKVDAPQPIPPEIDYDLWCGPAEKLPLMRKRLHYDWHWVWNTGNGDLGNQGIHEMDVARWFLGVMELSPRVLSVGGRLGYVDDGETPNTMAILHDYPGAPLIFEVRGLPSGRDSQSMDKYKGAGIGIVIECEGGHVTVPSYSSATAHDKEGRAIQTWSGEEDHYANFIKAVRSRKTEDLNADILEGHLSSALCHTGNISYRLGAKQDPGAIKEAIRADSGLAEAFDRMAEHLSANGVDLIAERATLGVPLWMDPKAERFVGNDAANALLTRAYRAPFVVPEKV